LPNYPLFRNEPHFESVREEPEMKLLLAELEDQHAEFRREFGAQDDQVTL